MGFFDKLSAIKNAFNSMSAPVYAINEMGDEAYNQFGNGRDFGILIGQSTGQLSANGDNNGIYANQLIWLNKQEICMNTIVFGGIGAGKTTRCMQPILQQVMCYDDVGGLIFDIKSDFTKAVDLYAKLVNREVIHIGISDTSRGINLIKGLTPEQVSSYLMSAIALNGGVGHDPFWAQAGIDLCRNTLNFLFYIDKYKDDKCYTLGEMYNYIFAKSSQIGRNAQIKEICEELEEKADNDDKEAETDLRIIEATKDYFSDVYESMETKMQQSIRSVITPILQPFITPAIMDAFSNDGTEEKPAYDLRGVTAGDIVVVDLPLSKWGIGGKVIYTIIKLRFFNYLQERQFDKTKPQNLCMFMCDEYQEIISASKGAGLDDKSFWDKSRSSGCFGIISTQSVNALKSVIDNEAITKTILANFRQKICFRTEDKDTIDIFKDALGQVEKVRVTRSDGGDYGTLYPMHKEGENRKFNFNNQTQIVDKDIVDASLIHNLDGEHALALLNLDGSGAEDVLIMPAYFDDGGGNSFFVNTVLHGLSNGKI